jgi:hypothetical protein
MLWGLPLFCNAYSLVILEGSMFIAVNLWARKNTPLPLTPTSLLRLP